jgi:hypothetical protein
LSQSVPFFTIFYLAHRIPAEKPSKFRLNAHGKSKKENLGNVSVITLTLPLAT